MGSVDRDLTPEPLAGIAAGLHGIYDLGSHVVVISGTCRRTTLFPSEHESWCGYLVRRAGADAQLILDR